MPYDNSKISEMEEEEEELSDFQEPSTLKLKGNAKALFVAAGEEKKRAPQGNYQQMVNTFLILLSYCVDLCTFVLLC